MRGDMHFLTLFECIVAHFSIKNYDYQASVHILRSAHNGLHFGAKIIPMSYHTTEINLGDTRKCIGPQNRGLHDITPHFYF